MPKISKNNIKITHQDVNKWYDVVVNYNHSNHFYAEVPNEFTEVVNHMDQKDLKDLAIQKELIKRDPEPTYRFITTGGSEADCLSHMRTCLAYLMPKTVKQRNVIILDCDVTKNPFQVDSRYNVFPKISLSLELIYAVETCVDNKKVYSQYIEYVAFSEKKISRKELNLGRKEVTVIDDTPENRIALENLYNAFKLLREKIFEFTSTEEKLLELISSNIKLLN